jgi:aspartate ammonia-lyase
VFTILLTQRDFIFFKLRPLSHPAFSRHRHCIVGMTATKVHLAKQVGSFVGVITALLPHIWYANAAKLAKEALATRRKILQTWL